MLEIILIVVLSKKIATMVREKGRSPAGYVVLFILLWILGEIAGAVVGVTITMARNPRAFDDDSLDLGVYGLAFVGALIGGSIGFVIASSVTPLESLRWDDDEDTIPRRRRRQRHDRDEELR